MPIRFDEMVTSPARLAILATLAPGGAVRFTQLKRATGLADGNLHVQTNKLAEAGYLEIRKGLHGRRSITEYRLTELGLTRFRFHVRQLQAVLDSEEGVIQPVLGASRRDDSQVWS